MLARLNEDFPKIKNTSANDLSDLINFIIELLNIRIDSSESEIERMDTQMLHVGSLIKQQYGYLTIPEVKEAMKMYVSRQFPNIKPFRLLDCISIGEVLTAYTEYRAEKLRDYDQKKARLQIEISQKADQNEILETRKKLVSSVYQEVKSKGFSNDCWLFYDFLYDNGVIKISNQEKRDLYKKELEAYKPKHEEEIRKKRALNTTNLINEFREQISKGETIPYVQNICKSKLVADFIKTLNSVEDFEKYVL